MNLQYYKTKYLTQRCQFVLLEDDGTLIASCNTLIDFSKLDPKISLFDLIPFLDSIKDVIIMQEVGMQPLVFPRIESSLDNEQSKAFDFFIERIDYEGRNTLAFILEENTKEHQYISQLQQEGKQNAIAKDYLEIQKHSIELEKELLALKNEELTRMEEFKSDFFSEVSHELRTPIQGIVGLTNLLIEMPRSQRETNYLRAIQFSGNHLVAMVNDILDLSKIEAGKMSFEEVSFNIRNLIQEIKLSFKYKVTEKNLHFNIYVDDQVPVLLNGDKLRLSQILFNLIGNAIKFTSQGFVNLELSLMNEGEEYCNLLFSVKDTGIGISEEKLSNIFERFSQASNSTSRIYGGTGLGLAIVKKIVELQGGIINVKSKINEGTSFSFTLPFKNAVEDEQNEDTLITPFLNPVNILVVEDDGVSAMILKQMLLNFNCVVEFAENGRVAIGKLQNTVYHLVCMDTYMPEMSGDEAIEYIRKEMKIDSSKLGILGITGTIPDFESMDSYKRADDYLLKPIKQSELYQKIKDLYSKLNPDD